MIHVSPLLIARVLDVPPIVLYERPDSMSWLLWWALFLGIGYALGSIPFGYLLTRSAGLGDVRRIGSGNIGATNVLRTGRRDLAALTLLLDALKGAAAVMICDWIGGRYAGLAIDGALLGGFGAFIGHLYPVWLGYKGGKGVATYIGVLAAEFWPGALVFCAIWLTMAMITRYSSLSALIAAVAIPLCLFAVGEVPAALLTCVMTCLLLWKHRANVGRLLRGEEPKIGAKA